MTARHEWEWRPLRPAGDNPPGGHQTSSLPTSGANLLALLVASVAFVDVGAGTIVVARHRRTGEIA